MVGKRGEGLDFEDVVCCVHMEWRLGRVKKQPGKVALS